MARLKLTKRIELALLLAAFVTLSELAGGTPRSQSDRRNAVAELKNAALVSPEPRYPVLAKAARVSGRVEVDIAIDEAGKVQSARAVSGHPLLKEAAVAAALQWKFDTAKLASLPSDSRRTLVFDFSLDYEPERRRTATQRSRGTESRSELLRRLSQAGFGKPGPKNDSLSFSLAELAVGAGENGLEEALQRFQEVESQGNLPADARPYYARLIFEYLTVRDGEGDSEEDRRLLEASLLRALRLFVQSYDAELEKRPQDPVKLADIGVYISQIHAKGQADDYCDSLKRVLSISDLPITYRARISYELGAAYWKRAYDATAGFVLRKETVPENLISSLRSWINEGYLHIKTTQNLDPTSKDAWFFEKLLLLQESLIESDADKRSLLEQRANDAQEQYLEKRKTNASSIHDANSRESTEPRYASGLPSLMVNPVMVLAPPPPPPPPPPPRTPGV